MITLTGHLICASEAEAAIVRAHLPQHIRLTQVEPGCLSFTVEATDDPLVWRVEERFVDAAAFQAHQARARTSLWGTATAQIRRSYRTDGA